MDYIGRYKVLSELGRGAMGIVYKAQDPTIGRLVAIKTIRLNEMSHPEEREQLRSRLFREAQSAGILNHPGIVTIYDIAEERDLAYIAMEFVDGQTLERIIDTGQLADAKTLISVASQTAVALDYAHGKGIIHRDIKPGNIMVTTEGAVKITDFGIARIASSKFTHTGTVMGTPSYMSPEQVRGAVVDGRSDMFSLAVVLYEMLTNQKPFSGDSITTIIFKIVSENPVPPKELNPSVGSKLNGVIMRALAKEPNERFQACREFADAIQAAAAQTANLTPTVRKMTALFGEGDAGDPAMATMPDRKTTPPAGPPPPPPPVAALAPTIVEEAPLVAPEPPPAPAPEPVVVVAPPPPPPAPEPVVVVALPPPPPAPESVVVMAAPLPSPVAAPEPPRVARPPSQPPVAGKKLPPLQAASPAPAPVVSAAPVPATGPRRGPWIAIAAVAVVAVAAGTLWWQTRRAPASEPPASTAVPEPSPAAPPTQVAPAPTTPPAASVAVPAGTTPTGTAGKTAADRVIRVTTAEPGARVVADGKDDTACTTPCSIPVGAGRHNLLFTQAGHFPERREVQVGREPVDLAVTLRPIVGTVMIATVPPGATVTVDGRGVVGETPLTLKLPIGKHLISAVKEGFTASQKTVEVTDDNILSVSITLGN